MSAIIAPVLTPTVSDGSTVNNVPGTGSTVQIGMVIYDNTPGSNMSELEQMKAMMEQMRLEKEQMRLEKEQMRLEKERYEMEAKRREEEAAMALRMEQEREMAIKEKKELDVVFSLFRDSQRQYCEESNMDFVWKNTGEEEQTFLKLLEASGETILLAQVELNGRTCIENNTKPKTGILHIVLTNCHLYYCHYKWVKINSASNCLLCGREGNCVSLNSGTLCPTTIYSFTNPLKLIHAKILLSIMAVPEGGDKWFWANRAIWYHMPYINCIIRGGPNHSSYIKKFESIIRLIPGSYKNGSWRQLDGFFGMYFNETTMELSEVPPPL